jgi:polysaccharide biosynthesis/export protein
MKGQPIGVCTNQTARRSLLTGPAGWAAVVAVLACGGAAGWGQTPAGSAGQSGASLPEISMPGTTTAQGPIPLPMANQSMLYPGEDFLLSPGDLLTVHVFGDSSYQPTVRVGLDGNVVLPYLGVLHLQGLTIREARQSITEGLRAGKYYRNPEISIGVMESQNGSVTISGEVRATVPVTGQRRLLDVLSAAGGLPLNASHTVRITRPGMSDPIVVNLGPDMTRSEAADLPIFPRDIITIARAGVVYALGAFTHQGSVPLDQASPLTLLQLVSLSGGAGFEGRFEDLRIIRTEGDGRKLLQVDFKKIRDGKATDPILQANDIVFLPTNGMKAIIKSLGTGGVVSLASILVSLHAGI